MYLEKWQPRFGSLARWDPFADLTAIRREMDRLFGESFGPMPATMALTEGMWSPLVDVHESKGTILVKAELPGMKVEDIEVSVLDDSLALRGQRKLEKEGTDDHSHRIERSYGAFQRYIKLPAPVAAEGIKATYKDGILEVTLPKKAEARARDIKVEAA